MKSLRDELTDLKNAGETVVTICDKEGQTCGCNYYAIDELLNPYFDGYVLDSRVSASFVDLEGRICICLDYSNDIVEHELNLYYD